MDLSGKKVVVGLTGRSDSAVAALLLKKQGMQVIGVSIVTNSSDSFTGPSLAPTCHIHNLDKVKEFCESLKIPFYATDAKLEYDATVFDPLLEGRLTAGANISCFNCTKMRMRILFEKMKKLKADYFATGHFCKVHKNLTSDEFFIHSNNDVSADQSYLLAGLSNDILKHLLLPLGELKSEEVQKICERFNLDVVPKEAKSGFCFTQKESYTNKIKEKIPKSLIQEGQVQNIDFDTVHGDHEGIVYHAIGDRHLDFKGLTSNEKDLEIVGYDFTAKVIQIGSKSNLTFKGFQIVRLFLGHGLDKRKPIICYLKSRFNASYIKCNLYFKNNSSAFIETDEELYPLIEGDNFVLFDRNTRNAKVIGLGVVGNRGDFELLDRVHEFRYSEDEDELGQQNVVKMYKF